MIKVIRKDITTVEYGVIAHGVNCQHKMASGVAAAIRKKWPVVYERYMASPNGAKMLGTAHCINIHPAFDNLFVCNCYTQNFYGYGGGRYASVTAVRESLEAVFELAQEYDLDVYLPKIGAGLGGLDWESEVLPIIERIDTEHNQNNTTYICEWD